MLQCFFLVSTNINIVCSFTGEQQLNRSVIHAGKSFLGEMLLVYAKVKLPFHSYIIFLTLWQLCFEKERFGTILTFNFFF